MADLPDDALAVVVTASNRAALGVYPDRSGPVLADGLRELGFTVQGPHVRPDDVAELEVVLREAVAAGATRPHHPAAPGLTPHPTVTPTATRAA
ncbi:molybdenum cofactor biosynthesis protein, partial [Modestobacter sp. VKM Ac-2676]